MAPTRRGRNKNSAMWDHFISLDNGNTATCKHCKVVLKPRGTGRNKKSSSAPVGTATGGGDGEPGASTLTTQRTMNSYVFKPLGTSQSARLTDLLVNVIVGDLRPISLVEGENFKNFVRHAVPGYSMPGRSTFTRKIEGLFSKTQAEMTSILAQVRWMALTTDIWSNVRMQSFVSLTSHFIEAGSFELKNLVLGTKEVVESHTGQNIAAWIESMLSEYSISPAQVVAVVTDNGANVVKACDLLHERHGWHHVRCVAHTLQLCLKEACDIPRVKEAIGAARHLVLRFRQSSKASTALRAMQENAGGSVCSPELVLDVPTRWNSTYQMLHRLCALQWKLRQILNDPEVIPRSDARHLELRDAHWLMIQHIVEELKPMKAATDFLEGDRHVSIGRVIPIVKGLIRTYSAEQNNELAPIKEFRTKIKQALQRTFSGILSENSTTLHDKGTWLDPEIKAKYFCRPKAFQVKAAIEEEATELQGIDAGVAPSQAQSPPDSVVESRGGTVAMLLSLGQEVNESSDESMPDEGNISHEVESYLQKKQGNYEELMRFWCESEELEYLRMLDAKYLCIPASSATSERCFSSAGLTATKLRSRLTGSHLEQLNILHCNKQLLQIKH